MGLLLDRCSSLSFIRYNQYRKAAVCGCFSFAVGLLCRKLEIVSNLRYTVFMKKGYRIISVEAADIYKHEQEYGVAVGYKLPEVKSDAYFWLFKNKLDYSLDCIELKKPIPVSAVKSFTLWTNEIITILI